MCCLLTPSLGKVIQRHVHVLPYYFLCKSSNSDIRPQVKWAVSLLIADSHCGTLIFLKGLCWYVWVNILTLSPQGLRMHRTARAYITIWIIKTPTYVYQDTLTEWNKIIGIWNVRVSVELSVTLQVSIRTFSIMNGRFDTKHPHRKDR